jgi:hypothetical protein
MHPATSTYEMPRLRGLKKQKRPAHISADAETTRQVGKNNTL